MPPQRGPRSSPSSVPDLLCGCSLPVFLHCPWGTGTGPSLPCVLGELSGPWPCWLNLGAVEKTLLPNTLLRAVPAQWGSPPWSTPSGGGHEGSHDLHVDTPHPGPAAAGGGRLLLCSLDRGGGTERLGSWPRVSQWAWGPGRPPSQTIGAFRELPVRALWEGERNMCLCAAVCWTLSGSAHPGRALQNMERTHTDFGIRSAHIILLLPSCLAIGKGLNSSVPQFPHHSFIQQIHEDPLLWARLRAAGTKQEPLAGAFLPTFAERACSTSSYTRCRPFPSRPFPVPSGRQPRWSAIRGLVSQGPRWETVVLPPINPWMSLL